MGEQVDESRLLLSTAAQNMNGLLRLFGKEVGINYDTNLLTTMLIFEEVAALSAILSR